VIVIDTSAIVAIFLCEPEAAALAAAIEADEEPIVSAASVLEASIVLRAKRELAPEHADQWLDAFLAAGSVSVEAVTVDQLRLARAAHARFGRGSGHAAQLNFGDCFPYALAQRRGASLLFKGEDFAQTDVGRLPETSPPR
jgi:ribonuclease VapC